ncbi:MAG: enoyl-CoA hydratase/isomerase family protein [Alphaproteobacteria bacterium]|nr:MAG: enoyl-CoA hydratase/isomerase family protein [Alphaproteobacteria bacterium]
MSGSDILRTHVDGDGVATLTMNRPKVHNAFNADLIAALDAAFRRLGSDGHVRVIVLRGEGASFSAGGDLADMKAAAAAGPAENEADAGRLSAMLHSLNTVPKPTIALVHGSAFGGGVGLVACADIAVAAAAAQFALTEVRLGLIPAAISPYVLAAMGARAARRYVLTGERFDAATAQSLGLVHQVVDSPDALQDAARKHVQALLAGGPQALADAKALIFDIAGRPIDAALRQDTARRIARVRAGAEAREGISAFFDKRAANWVRR